MENILLPRMRPALPGSFMGKCPSQDRIQSWYLLVYSNHLQFKHHLTAILLPEAYHDLAPCKQRHRN